MSGLVDIMMKLISCEICGKEWDFSHESLDEEELERLFRLSKKQDVAHIVSDGLLKFGLINDNSALKAAFQKESMLALYRYQKLSYDLKKISDTLEKNAIPHMPLKGSVLRASYPKPWMRTSCDIDVLVKEEDLERAKEALCGKLGYKAGNKNSHDLPFETSSGMHLELHYNLIESSINEMAEGVLSEVWDKAVLCEGSEYRYSMPSELFYFYHIAHMAKHFVNGGCGVRSLLDLWIMEHKWTFSEEEKNNLLQRGGLSEFTKEAVKLSECWFSFAPLQLTQEKMQEYIINGGIYGNMENRITVQQTKRGGKLKYAMSRIFLPCDILKYKYPVLNKHRWLLPFMQVRRWFSLVFCGRLKSSVRELKINGSVSADDAKNTAELLNKLGLK